jgi:hypothetical protein
MKLPQTGRCQCGKIRYEITEAPQLVYACHCRDCRRLTSSAFLMGVIISETGFRLSGVEPRSLQRLADSGANQHTMGLPRVRLMDCRPGQGWPHPGQGGHAGRYVMAATDAAYLDP